MNDPHFDDADACPHPGEAVTPILWVCGDCGATITDLRDAQTASQNYTVSVQRTVHESTTDETDFDPGYRDVLAERMKQPATGRTLDEYVHDAGPDPRAFIIGRWVARSLVHAGEFRHNFDVPALLAELDVARVSAETDEAVRLGEELWEAVASSLGYRPESELGDAMRAWSAMMIERFDREVRPADGTTAEAQS